MNKQALRRRRYGRRIVSAGYEAHGNYRAPVRAKHPRLTTGNHAYTRPGPEPSRNPPLHLRPSSTALQVLKLADRSRTSRTHPASPENCGPV